MAREHAPRTGGTEARAVFWDTVIASNPVVMDVDASHEAGNEVANVSVISTTASSPRPAPEGQPGVSS